MLTLIQLKEALRDKLNDPEYEPDGVTVRKTRWSNTILELKLNLGNQDVVSRAKCIKKSVDMNTTEGTREYPITATDFMVLDEDAGIEYGATDPLKEKLDFKTILDLDREDSGWKNSSNGTPEKCYLKEYNIVGLEPAPDADHYGTGYLRIPYIPIPATLSGEQGPFNDEIGFMDRDCELLVLWAYYMILFEEGKKEEGAIIRGEYLSGVDNLAKRKREKVLSQQGLKPHPSYARRD